MQLVLSKALRSFKKNIIYMYTHVHTTDAKRVDKINNKLVVLRVNINSW